MLPTPVLMQAPDSDWTPTLRDKRSTTSYLIVVGNLPPPAERKSQQAEYIVGSLGKIPVVQTTCVIDSIGDS